MVPSDVPPAISNVCMMGGVVLYPAVLGRTPPPHLTQRGAT